jgi:hypothetical protein
MTQDQITLFEAAISLVSNSPSTILAKEDVIALLSSMQENFAKLPVSTSANYNCDEIVRAFNDILEEYDFDEFVSFEPELQGSYGSSYSLEINHSFEDDDFRRCIINDIEKYFVPNKS